MIDLGFVDISSGVAVPANNPLSVSGVSSGGASASSPSSLSDNVFTTTDLKGTWYTHELDLTYSTDEDPGWTNTTLVIDDKGNYTNTITSSDGDSDTATGILSIGPSGVITVSGEPSINGFISSNKNIITITAGDSDAYQLAIFQKSGDSTYSQSDLKGTWHLNQIDSNGDYFYRTLDIDAGGSVTTTSVIVNGVAQDIPDGRGGSPPTHHNRRKRLRK